MEAIHTLRFDHLLVHVFPTRKEMGTAAGKAVVRAMRQRLQEQEHVTLMFAAAPSQVDMLNTLASEPGVDWRRVVAFQLDEYVGLPEGAPESFHAFLRRYLFDRVHPGVVHALRPVPGADPEEEARRYEELLREARVDIACIGIGENGHLAFNDPHNADFDDPHLVKVVELAEESRRQQVNDGQFPNLDAVPRWAITVTIPAIMRSRQIFCVVPLARKAQAVRATLLNPISSSCPATALRTHPHSTLFLDMAAASLLAQGGYLSLDR